MILRITQLHEQADWMLARFAQRLTAPNVQYAALPWTIAGLVGLVLGAYVLGISSLSWDWTILLLLAVLCPFIVMIVGNIRRLLLAVVLLDIPFQLDIYLFYQEEFADRGATGGLNISVATLALVGLYGLWLMDLLYKVESPKRSLFRLSSPLALYVLVVTLSLAVAHYINLAIFEIFLLGQTFLLFVYIVNSVRTRQDVLFIVTILLIGLVLESLVMIGLRAIGHSVTIANITARIMKGGRVAGTIGSPNTAASYLTLLIAPALSLLFSRLGRGYKWLAALAFGLGGIALLFTLSRGGWLAVIVSLTVLCFLAWRRGWLSLTVPIAVITVVVLLAVFFQDFIMARLLEDDNGSAGSRIPLMQIALRMIVDNPLGVGANNFGAVMMRYATLESAGAWLYTVHNKYLLVWAETGIVGLVTFLWFLLATVYRGWQGWKFKDRFLSPIVLGFTAGILGQMTHMLVDLFHSRPQVQMLWVIAGLIAAISTLDHSAKGS